jgi:N-carbamoylputrescine amidase
MTATPFTLGLIQMAMAPDPAVNLARAIERIERAAAAGAGVIVLPELFLSHYFCQVEHEAPFALAEPIPGPTTEALAPLARRLNVALVVSLFERRAAGVYHNSLAILDADGRLAAVYRKMHIPDDPGFTEKYYFTPGDTDFMAVPTRHARLGPLVCWDQWYPEAARLTALRGAEILLYPTAIGWLPSEKAADGAAQRDAWRTVQRGHAIANGVFVAAVNRVGHEMPAAGEGEGIEFWGGSFVCDPLGRVLAEAGPDEETLIVPIDPAAIEQTRRIWPFFRDRRIDAYAGLDQRWIDPPAKD